MNLTLRIECVIQRKKNDDENEEIVDKLLNIRSCINSALNNDESYSFSSLSYICQTCTIPIDYKTCYNWLAIVNAIHYLCKSIDSLDIAHNGHGQLPYVSFAYTAYTRLGHHIKLMARIIDSRMPLCMCIIHIINCSTINMIIEMNDK